MKEELLERISELEDKIENGYMPNGVRQEEQEKLDFLYKLKKALYPY